jgi:methyl-accepting chemotaxis protein
MNRISIRIKLLLFFMIFLCLAIDIPAVAIRTIDPRVEITGNWFLTYTDSNENKNPELNISSWETVQLPLSRDRNRTNGSQYMWIRSSVNIGHECIGQKVFLLLGKIDGSIEVYLNGVLVHFRGKFPPDYSYMASLPKQTLLPPELIRYDNDNVICIRIFNEFSSFTILSVELGDFNAYIFDSFFLKFLNVDIYLLYSFLSFLIGGYFLLQYVSRRSEKTNLHFSLANFCFGIYFLSMGLEFNVFPFRIATAISQSCLPLFFALLVIFFVNYFKIYNNKWLKRVIMGFGIFLASLFFININFPPLIPGLFTFVLLPSALELIFLVYVSVKATIQKNKDAPPIMIGALCGFALGVHDMICQVFGIPPVIWLQGTGIFLFNMSMFVSLVNRTMNAFKSLEVYSVEIVSKTGELETYIDNITDVSNKVSEMSRNLEESISSASSSIENMVKTSQRVITDIRNQFDTVRNTSTTVKSLLDSFEVTYEGLNKQFTQVRETSSTIEEMIATINEITISLQHTTEYTEELKKITAQGEEAVLASSKSIGDILVVSNNVNKIIDAVSDITEQTNVLSINAAIEASHAGVYGRGFAVVAGEIRRLAEGSARMSREIAQLVKTIAQKIEDGASTNSRVKDVFLSINKKTISAVEQVESVYAAILEEKKASENILKILSLLDSSSEEIKKQVDSQDASSGFIRTNLDGLVLSSQTVLNVIMGITGDIEIVLKNISYLKTLSADSVGLIRNLKTILRNDNNI